MSKIILDKFFLDIILDFDGMYYKFEVNVCFIYDVLVFLI